MGGWGCQAADVVERPRCHCIVFVEGIVQVLCGGPAGLFGIVEKGPFAVLVTGIDYRVAPLMVFFC